MKAWPVLGILLMQALLALAHWFIYRTLVVFFTGLSPAGALALRIAISLLAFSFMATALLGFYFDNWPVRALYKVAAIWLGYLNFFFFAACLCWLAGLALPLTGLPPNRPLIAGLLFSLAAWAGIYGMVNALLIRIPRIVIALPNLPPSWRGRRAVLLSDLHLGNVNGTRFCRRVVALAAGLAPDIVFLPGDLFDGVKADPDNLIAPFKALSPPLGIYFATGNHDEFGGINHFAPSLKRAGFHVLANESVTVDGLHIAGVVYGDSSYPMRLRAILESLRLPAGQPSILLNHAPTRLPVVEQAGISLQLSGHTHGGQIFPFNWFTRRVFGKYTYGLHRFGALQVYTSSGAGTWGPPMRIGTHPEIVLITFE